MERPNVATILAPVAERVQHRLGEPAPVAVRFWDGSALEPLEDPAPLTLVVRSPRALGLVAREPNRSGLGRALATGELDVEGDPDSGGLAARLGELRLTRADRVAAAWAAWRVGALRATPRAAAGSGSARRARPPRGPARVRSRAPRKARARP